ncbi:pancreatic alpha-amylase-like isoform X5 [Sceloporus undulatus]|uniref:pancreatic alpha-amylase-like isoform X5 n=1 Tax=Sceloporus undulatus TaxID=8520 RepID=UPI001C4D51D8|nr:pancreatic alpha-amylase-like isoform X5 [Sceloporus undulatus]
MNAGLQAISGTLQRVTQLHLMKRTQALFSKECKRLLRRISPIGRDNMKSLLLLLIAAFGLCWTQYKSDPKPGRTSIVHLFEWRWADVALECERYLAPNGFAAVQVSPPNENLVIMNPWRPWWERYQPISYKLCSRSGNENEFRDMVTRCNNVGVRNCRLCGLVDLAQSREDVRSKIAGYMNHLVDLGVAGFRIDASKHIWPEDINAILNKVNNLNTRWFIKGSRPFIYQEVIDLGGEAVQSSEYFRNGRVTEFKYGAQLGNVLRKWNGEKMANLKNLGENWSLMPSDKAIVFVDNHDNQRGHGAGGASILTFWNPRLYKMALGFMLAHPYGFTRIISSYRWPRDIQHGKDLNDWIGPPSNSDGTIKPVTINPDGSCGNGWVCEHRWNQIRNMVMFRNVVHRQPITNWWDNNNQVAFGRDGKGFIVFNNDDRNLSISLPTGLPPGIYCDVISGQKDGNLCTGIQIHVAANGIGDFQINSQAEDPFIAIHVEAKL